jgi:transposase
MKRIQKPSSLQFTLESFMTFNEPFLFGHADTTSVSLYREYDLPPTEGVVQIVKGFNKDNQRDANQIIAGIVTIHNGIPSLVIFAMEIRMTPHDVFTDVLADISKIATSTQQRTYGL